MLLMHCIQSKFHSSFKGVNMLQMQVKCIFSPVNLHFFQLVSSSSTSVDPLLEDLRHDKFHHFIDPCWTLQNSIHMFWAMCRIFQDNLRQALHVVQFFSFPIHVGLRLLQMVPRISTYILVQLDTVISIHRFFPVITYYLHLLYFFKPCWLPSTSEGHMWHCKWMEHQLSSKTWNHSWRPSRPLIVTCSMFKLHLFTTLVHIVIQFWNKP